MSIIRTYDHLISIGLNCEIRYQLQKRFGTLDSSLLAWASVNPRYLCDVLKDPHLIFSGNIHELPRYNMWRCLVTDITFHGARTVAELRDNSGHRDENKVAVEREDTISRVHYLCDKFTCTAQSTESKLYIIGIHPRFCKYKGRGLKKFIYNLSDTIQSIAVNASLLVVAAKDTTPMEIKELDNKRDIFVRFIDHFAPRNSATNSQYVDLKRGGIVFNEFRPRVVKTKNKTYKYEKM